ncbi:nuclear pore protein 84/107 [Syncephalis fuscata]|nr:nuclear pore protein 84/107 [Syncephalis fuscata]
MSSPSLLNEINLPRRVTRSDLAAFISGSIAAGNNGINGGLGVLGRGAGNDDSRSGDPYAEFAYWLSKADSAQLTTANHGAEEEEEEREEETMEYNDGEGNSRAVEAALYLLEQFSAISMSHLEELRDQQNNTRYQNNTDTDTTLTNWEREWSTWRLLFAMYQERICHKKELANNNTDMPMNPSDPTLATDVQIFTPLFTMGSGHTALREYVIVKNWLQEVAPRFQPVGPRAGYWFYTSRFNGVAATGSLADPEATKIVHHLDPDAPSHQEFDKYLMRTLYEYLRRGQVNQAMDLCRKSDQSWRAASISGSTMYSDDSLVDRGDQDEEMLPPTKRQKGPQGNPRRLLWKSMCRQLSKNMDADIYERAMYALLVGEVEPLLMVSQNWEDYLFAYYNAMIETELDQHLAQKRGKYQEMLKSWTPEEIFDRLSKSDQPDIRASSVEPFHYIQSLVIQDQLDTLAGALSSNFTELNDFDENMQHVLRFAAHWVIVMRQLKALPFDHAAGDQIVRCYVDLLIAIKKNNLVAQYCALLPESLQIHAYASFLRTLEQVSKDERYKYLQKARDCHMNVQAITVQVVQMILEAYKSSTDASLMFSNRSVSLTLIHSAVEENDQEQIRALEWLFFEPSQSKDAIIQASHLARRFLVLGKLNAVKVLLDSIPSDIRAVHSTDEVVDQTDALSVAVREISGYANLCLFEDKFAEWALFTKESHAISDSKNEYDLLVKVKTLVNDMERLANQLLITEWLVVDIEESQLDPFSPSAEQRRQECGKIRELYLTELTIQLFMILYESEEILPGSMEKSLNLSHLVANVEYGLYTEFVRAGRMAELLELLRRAAVALSSSNTTVTPL